MSQNPQFVDYPTYTDQSKTPSVRSSHSRSSHSHSSRSHSSHSHSSHSRSSNNSSRSSRSSRSHSTGASSRTHSSSRTSYTDSIERLRNEINTPPERYINHWYPNPAFLRILRFVLYTLTSFAAVITAVFAICVIQWYNAHGPSIKPAWSSDIALVVFGLGTPPVLYFNLLIAPRVVRKGGVAASLVGQVRSELLLLFAAFQIWISGSIAMAADLRGYENCIWDGYYHWPQPSDFHHVCDLINYTVIFGYVTMGLVVLQWVVVTTIAIYILLYLDQEVLTEPINDMGGRAYRAHVLAVSMLSDRQIEPLLYEKQKSPNSRVLPGPMSGGRLLRESLPSERGSVGPGPFAGGRRTASISRRGPEVEEVGGEGAGRYRDRIVSDTEEEERLDTEEEVGRKVRSVRGVRRRSGAEGERSPSPVGEVLESPVMGVERLRTGADEGYYGYEVTSGLNPFEARVEQ